MTSRRGSASFGYVDTNHVRELCDVAASSLLLRDVFEDVCQRAVFSLLLDKWGERTRDLKIVKERQGNAPLWIGGHGGVGG